MRKLKPPFNCEVSCIMKSPHDDGDEEDDDHIKSRAGQGRRLEISSHSPERAPELPDRPKRSGSSVSMCQVMPLKCGVWVLCRGQTPGCGQSQEPGAAPGTQLAGTDMQSPGGGSDGLGILWEMAHLATGRAGAWPVLQTLIATRCWRG